MALINYKCGKCGMVTPEVNNTPQCPVVVKDIPPATAASEPAPQQRVVSTANGHAWTMAGMG